MLRSRLTLSELYMQKRHERWRESEEIFRAYMPEQAVDASRRAKREEGVPQYTTLVVPYSYAILLTAHTYWTSVFLSRTPVFQFAGRHGEPEMAVQALEALIDYQVNVGEMLVPLYVWLLDPGKYGFGVVVDYWDETEELVSSIREVPQTFLGVSVPGKTKKERVIERRAGYVGNRLSNVRPQDFYPDPRVPLAFFQKGEFCGHKSSISLNELVRGEKSGYFFNVDVVRKRHAKGSISSMSRTDTSSQIELPAEENAFLPTWKEGVDGPWDRFQCTVELIPSEWGLGTTSYPEKWVFSLIANDVIIEAQPLGHLHNKFPYNLIEYEVDGHAINSRGLLEVIKPLNDTMTWLVNAHFYNVRKAMNDQIVYDPAAIVSSDLTVGGPGRRIRLSPRAYGTNPAQAIYQIPFNDVTQQHIRDLTVIAELVQRATGVSDNLMGVVNAGGRKTATEVRTSSSFGINRLKTNTEYFSAMGFMPLAQKLVQNTQQFYDMDRKFRIAGDLLAGAPSFVNVTPESIQGFFDFVPVDGTLPVDRFAQAALWKEMIAGIMRVPPIAMSYDVAGIFSWVAKLSGLRNIDRFKVQVEPDAAVMGGVQAGNVVPISSAVPGAERGPQISQLGPVS
jgi:hypothetical protein